jgi:predicted transcriptional regulator
LERRPHTTSFWLLIEQQTTNLGVGGSNPSGRASAKPSQHCTTRPSRRPAVSVKKSITPDHIVCLEDGKKFKSLKRHLRTQYNMTPEQYREKWALGADYPMVAPSYAAARSQLAKQMGLGQQRRHRAK